MFLFLFSFLLLTTGLAWRCGFYRQLTGDRQLSIALYPCFVFFVFFIFSFLIALLLVQSIFYIGSFAQLDSSWQKLWLLPAMAFLAGFLFFSLAYFYKRHIVEKLLSINLKAFIFGCLSWFIYFPLQLFLQSIVSPLMDYFKVPFVDQNAVESLKSTAQHLWPFIFNSLAAVVVAPLMEEFLFRGILQNALQGVFRRPFAIVLSALIFSIFHLSPQHGLRNIELMIYLFALSCYLGFVYERWRSLWASIGLHFFSNLVSVLRVYLPGS